VAFWQAGTKFLTHGGCNMSIQAHCAALAKAMNAKFSIKGDSLSYSKVFSEVGMLPRIVRRANNSCLLLGYGLGVTFEDEERSMLGLKVIFDDVTPMSLRLLFILDVVAELIEKSTKKGVTVLDELIHEEKLDKLY